MKYTKKGIFYIYHFYIYIYKTKLKQYEKYFII